MRTPARLAIWMFAALVSAGCESDGGGTRCGEERCDPMSEICVRHQLGIRVTHECAALPDGCDEERGCAACDSVCEAPADTCADSEADNTVVCSCIECRAPRPLTD